MYISKKSASKENCLKSEQVELKVAKKDGNTPYLASLIDLDMHKPIDNKMHHVVHQQLVSIPFGFPNSTRFNFKDLFPYLSLLVLPVVGWLPCLAI